MHLQEGKTELNQIRRALADAEDRAIAMHAACLRYTQTFDHVLDAYHKQRAWKAMLAVRRAYTMIVHGGWRPSGS